MARRKKGRAVNGWLVLDKPLGRTSTQALGAVKRLFDAQKAGHAGTLDPLATGILPIAFGEATKTVSYAVDGEKAYRFTVTWGNERTTDDTEGEIVASSETRPSVAEIEALLPQFTGEISQVPPQFSAIKVAGNRAYDLARDGEVVELQPRIVNIDDLRLLGAVDANSAIFEAECGKGTYVRAIARDLGRALGCYGHVSELRRLAVGSFTEEEAVSMDELVAAHEEGGAEALDSYLQPVESALEDLTELAVTPSDASELARGKTILLRGRDAPVFTGGFFAMCKGQLVAIGDAEKGQLRPNRVFNLGR
ncbi:tRNA pseudouridine synthase B [Candidatus Filomicrobium marinum]|uniref:tRNA pseudouridine synthase B n=1 Tax=Candidatus Filomicrobium marinum TaxID=1608628 RepID=A0A0D6JFP2_9HYPH|nr:tRNA pseudouridine(55) synthase TruB [Candidatus Filomicrobium marinum]CFX27729.1 tRNA pseudouridine synthase B [Candidatus Filomicrobium marinum]CPR19594.1 tRNA pseudouridine synthase B [Candidatus Filomicrobium marinum]